VFWVAFNAFILLLLALDLFVFQRKQPPPQPRAGVAHDPLGQRAMSFREALAWSAFWIALAAAFAGLIYFWRGAPKSLEFITGWTIEESLSVDNLFVFLVLFQYFRVPPAHQRRVLTYGIIGALVLRGIFILVGVSLIHQFHWIIYLFGAFLIYTAFKLLRSEAEEKHPEKGWVLRIARRYLPVTPQFHGERFVVFDRETGRRLATPLLLVLIVVEATDVLFAADSIPAVLAISRDPFIVYTSNVFAILGLRALYFTLVGLMQAFHLLHYGLAAILAFIGVKMLASARYDIPTPIALMVVAAILGISIITSLLIPVKTETADD
jgi:tellurite resistance protein TerC